MHNEHLSVIDFKKQERSKEVARLENKLENTDKLIQYRKELLQDVENVIDRLDGEYQEKKEAVKTLEAELSDKSAALSKLLPSLQKICLSLTRPPIRSAKLLILTAFP